jgi:hypothetical protein
MRIQIEQSFMIGRLDVWVRAECDVSYTLDADFYRSNYFGAPAVTKVFESKNEQVEITFLEVLENTDIETPITDGKILEEVRKLVKNAALVEFEDKLESAIDDEF